MKLRHLWLLGMSSVMILSACGQNSDDNHKDDNDHKIHKKADKDSNKSKKQSNNAEISQEQNSNQEVQSNSNKEAKTNKQNTQDNEPITIDEAKSIAYKSKDIHGFVQDKGKLIYNKDKSNNDEVFIETPFGGINTSVKHHAIIDRHTGEIIKTGGGITHPDGPIKAKNGYIDKDVYNTAANFYNTYVHKQGMPKYETTSSDVPEEKYKQLSKLLNSYSNEQKNKENKSSNVTTEENKVQNENEGNQPDNNNQQSANDQRPNKDNETDKTSNQEPKADEHQKDEHNEHSDEEDKQSTNEQNTNTDKENDENTENNNDKSEQQENNKPQEAEPSDSENDNEASNES
ncbi:MULTISPECIES: hypothetical protein [Staphylococcus]|uniref:hypothetical protein n=1 Tax=Staphylococcus TaxID=1279 RepID=UPI0007DA3DDA|nr:MULTISPECIES: hypothetical protein [Staphylococcus]OAO11351.1 hypothetical protein A4A82_01945 [Staphylococcus cohnii]RIM85336.1 hypothetical protein BU109_12320 [Staphylococcus xylosus]